MGTEDVEGGRFAVASRIVLFRQFCQTEIKHLHVTVAPQHDVLWLNVAMHNTGIMRCRKRRGSLLCNIDSFTQLQGPDSQTTPQCFAVNVLHRDVWPTLIGFTYFMNYTDVRMAKRRSRSRFALEPPQSFFVVNERLGKQFKRNLATQPRVMGQIHLPHSSATEERKDFVMRNCLADHRAEIRMRQ